MSLYIFIVLPVIAPVTNKNIYAIKVFDINMPYLEIQFDGLREYVGENEFKLAIDYYNVINRYLNTNGQLNYLNYNITCEDIL